MIEIADTPIYIDSLFSDSFEESTYATTPRTTSTQDIDILRPVDIIYMIHKWRSWYESCLWYPYHIPFMFFSDIDEFYIEIIFDDIFESMCGYFSIHEISSEDISVRDTSG